MSYETGESFAVEDSENESDEKGKELERDQREVTASQERHYRRGKIFAFAMVYVAHVVCGLVLGVYGENSENTDLAFFVAAFVFVVMSLFWCQLDARLRGDKVGRGFLFGLIFLNTLFLLIYLFRSRSWRAFLSIFLLFIHYLLCSLIAVLMSDFVRSMLNNGDL